MHRGFGCRLRSSPCFLQDRDLPGVVNIVLQRSHDLAVERALLAGNILVEILAFEARDSIAQAAFGALELLQRALPRHRRYIRPVWNRSPVDVLARDASPDDVEPCSDVHDQLEYRMAVANRPGFRLRFTDAVEQVAQRGPVPRFAAICPIELIEQPLRWSHVLPPNTCTTRQRDNAFAI